MNRIIIIFLFTLLSSTKVQSQQINFAEKMRFTQYLIDNSEYKDATFFLKNINETTLNKQQKDSLNFFKGWSHYNVKAVDSSEVYLNKVSEDSPLYYKASFYKVFDQSYALKFKEADSSLKQISLVDSSLYSQLKLYDAMCLSLLRKDLNQFDFLMKSNTLDNYTLKNEQSELKKYADQMRQIKRKSPLLAASYSALIPGLGKLYAGFPGQALASFLSVTTMAAVATENYIKAGPRSGRFIAYASIFSIFYAGNIWGSAVSVKLKRKKKYNEIQHNILLDMHIPLRRAFE